jgi:hypothetical protein
MRGPSDFVSCHQTLHRLRDILKLFKHIVEEARAFFGHYRTEGSLSKQCLCVPTTMPTLNHKVGFIEQPSEVVAECVYVPF